MLQLPCESYECLRMLTNGLANVTNALMNDANVLPTFPLSCQGEWETAKVTNALQMPYEHCKCFRMSYQRYQWLANAYEY